MKCLLTVPTSALTLLFGCGRSIQPAHLTLSATSIDLGASALDRTTSRTIVHVKNESGPDVPLDVSVDPVGEFHADSQCAGKLATQASCDVLLTFTPAAVDVRAATLKILIGGDTAATVQLRGRGLARLTVTLGSVAHAVGLVQASPVALSCSGNTCEAAYEQSAQVSLTAAAGPAASFWQWSGACSGPSPACSLTVSLRHETTATFRPQANLSFVTSGRLAMPFGRTVAESLSAADAFCNAHASAAHLPGHYVAWLSTSTGNALSRLANADGWVRSDGRAFLSRALLSQAHTLYPPLLDEHEYDTTSADPRLATGSMVATGTSATGDILPSETCSDWTSVSGQTRSGVSGFRDWSAGPFRKSCAGPFELYCFEDSTSVQVSAQAQGRILFVSRQIFSTTSGRAAADAICQQEAAQAALPGTFLALLATSTQHALARFDLNGAPWVRPDGVQLVQSADQIGDDRAMAPIYLNADGHPDSGSLYVWTGATSLLQTGQATCGDWTSTIGSGDGGDDSRTVYWFSEFRSSMACAGPAHVFCAQQ